MGVATEFARRALFRALSRIRGERLEIAEGECALRASARPTPSCGPGSRSSTPARTAGRCAAAPGSARATSRGCGAATTWSRSSRIACRNLPPLDALRAPRCIRCSGRCSGRRPRPSQHPRRGAREHLGPLRPRQRAVRGVPRPAAGLLVRGLRAARTRPSRTPSWRSWSGSATGLELGPDDHLLEIGTGWGGLAIHAAATRGCRVTTTTISREQHAYAAERVREAGLADRVEVLLDRLPRPRAAATTSSPRSR